MLLPKNTKHRKQHKGRIHGKAKGNHDLAFGFYGLKALQPERITSRQIEASRRAITRYLKRAGRLWIMIFPDVPVTGKPAEVRMGKGKGSVEYWACRGRGQTLRVLGLSCLLWQSVIRTIAAALRTKGFIRCTNLHRLRSPSYGRSAPLLCLQ